MSNLIKEMFDEVFGSDLEKFQRGMDEFLEEVYKDAKVPSFSLSKGSYPKVNIVEKQDKYQIVAAVPGMSKDDLEVKYEEGMLSIIGKNKNEKLDKGERFISRELKKSSFMRSFRIDPSKIDVNKIKCKFEHGELMIDVFKKEKDTENGSVNINID